MKRAGTVALFLLFAFSYTVSGADQFPARPAGPVADYASVIDAATAEKITAIAQALWEQAGFALVVAAVPGIGDMAIDDYANRLYEKWGIGQQGRDEGALVLLSINPRKARIDVGYGAEGYINDAKAGRILDTCGVPSFRAGKYAAGLLSVSTAIAGIVAEEKGISLSISGIPIGPTRGFQPARRFSLLQTIFFIILAAILLGTRFGRAILWGMLLSGMLGGRRSGGGFGGGFGGGGFGGGFGGGMSGGGGASRSF